MLVKIPDELYLRYEEAAKRATPRITTEELLTRQLLRFVDYPASRRTVVATGDALERMEKLLGGGQIQTPEQLLSKIRAWAGISLGNIRLSFTQAQLEEIAHRAEKQGKTPKEVAQAIVEQIADQFFNAVPTT